MDMSTQKRIIVVLLALITGLPLAATLAQDDEERDPVLEFYRERAAGQIRSRNPLEAGLSYALEIRAYVYRMGRGGKPEPVDSAAFTRYYSFGELDSQQVHWSTSERPIEVDLSYPNVFAQEYHFRFYPNDTGGTALAIGFESDTTRNLSPVGLAVIDRTHYSLRQLYLHYPANKAAERRSRTLSFTERQGFIFPDTITTAFARAGIFSTDYFRIDAYVDSIRTQSPMPDSAQGKTKD